MSVLIRIEPSFIKNVFNLPEILLFSNFLCVPLSINGGLVEAFFIHHYLELSIFHQNNTYCFVFTCFNLTF